MQKFCLFIFWFVATASSASAESEHFAFLNNVISEATASFLQHDRAGALEGSAASTEEKARAAFYPVLQASAQGSLNKSYSYNDGERLNPSDSKEISKSVGVSLRENLYNGGLDLLRFEQGASNAEQDRLERQARVTANSLLLAREIIRIAGLAQQNEQNKQETEQANLLLNITRRKEKSGFLGVTSLLETERETLRTENEVEVSKKNLQNTIETFNASFGLTQQKQSETSITQYHTQIAAELESNADRMFSIDSKKVSTEMLDVRLANLRLLSNEKDVETSRRSLWAPSVDLSASLASNFPDVSNKTPKELYPNRVLQTEISLNANLPLFNAQSYATSSAAINKKLLSSLELEDTRQKYLQQIDTHLQDVKIQKEKKARLEKLVSLSNDIVKKNDRLFDAGEIDITEVIRTRQDLYNSLRSLAETQTQYELSLFELLCAVDFGVIPSSAP